LKKRVFISLKWPFGHPLGEPFNVRQQRAVLIEMFNALYTIKKPGEIIDIPFKWKRGSYNDYFEITHDKEIIVQEAIENIGKNRKETLNTIDSRVLKDLKTLHLIKKPLFWGLTAGLSLLSAYFLILTIANSFSHSIEQFREMWYWVSLIVAGFGIQAGLFTYIRGVMKFRKEFGIATSSMAAAGGMSTTSMVACCAQYFTDILPILGVSAAVVFLNRFQDLFLTIGVLSNLIGISLMFKIIQKHKLYQQDQRIFSALMKFNMNRSFYFVSIFSAFIFLVTLYKSV
jgi:hypothetical protein